MSIDFVDVINAADVGMRDLSGHPNFGVELGQSRGIAIHIGGQELQCDGLAELQVVGAKDFSHPAAAEASDDAVASAEEGAGGESTVIDIA